MKKKNEKRAEGSERERESEIVLNGKSGNNECECWELLTMKFGKPENLFISGT